MRPRTLVLAAVLASLLVAVPTAVAQRSASASVALRPFERALHASDHNETMGRLSYMADATANLALSGLPVQYVVTKAPSWALVRVSPSSDVIPTGIGRVAGGASVVASLAFAVIADTPANATGDLLDEVEITAIVQGASPGGVTVAAKASLPLHLVQDAHVCPAPAAGASQPAAASSSDALLAKGDASAPQPNVPQPSAPVHVQSATTSVPAVSYVALAGFALAGAGVGLFLRRRV